MTNFYVSTLTHFSGRDYVLRVHISPNVLKLVAADYGI